MIRSTNERIHADFSSEILNVPKLSHFLEARKSVTLRGVTIWRLYSYFHKKKFQIHPVKFQF